MTNTPWRMRWRLGSGGRRLYVRASAFNNGKDTSTGMEGAHGIVEVSPFAGV